MADWAHLPAKVWNQGNVGEQIQSITFVCVKVYYHYRDAVVEVKKDSFS